MTAGVWGRFDTPDLKELILEWVGRKWQLATLSWGVPHAHTLLLLGKCGKTFSIYLISVRDI